MEHQRATARTACKIIRSSASVTEVKGAAWLQAVLTDTQVQMPLREVMPFPLLLTDSCLPQSRVGQPQSCMEATAPQNFVCITIKLTDAT